MDQVGDTLVQGQFTRHLASRTRLGLCPNDTEPRSSTILDAE